jgi:hypothetical protein
MEGADHDGRPTRWFGPPVDVWGRGLVVPARRPEREFLDVRAGPGGGVPDSAPLARHLQRLPPVVSSL